MSFFRSIWKGNSKHKKLYDEWALANVQDEEKENQTEEASFTLKYLGSTIVSSAASETATADAVKVILNMSKASKKTPRVNVSVSQRGIRVTNPSTNESQLEISIYRISYCSADANNSHVFAFIATNPDESLECHAFLCPKRKVAQTVSLTVAQMFNCAFQEWQISQEQQTLAQGRSLSSSPVEEERDASASPEMARIPERQPTTSSALLIDLDAIVPTPKNTWVNFDNDNVPDYNFSSDYLDNVRNGNSTYGNVNSIWDQSTRKMACS